MISHADIDHFNGVAGLMQSVPVGRLFVSQQFLDFQATGREGSLRVGFPNAVCRSNWFARRIVCGWTIK